MPNRIILTKFMDQEKIKARNTKNLHSFQKADIVLNDLQYWHNQKNYQSKLNFTLVYMIYKSRGISLNLQTMTLLWWYNQLPEETSLDGSYTHMLRKVSNVNPWDQQEEWGSIWQFATYISSHSDRTIKISRPCKTSLTHRMVTWEPAYGKISPEGH